MQKGDKFPELLVWVMAPYFMINVVFGGFIAVMPIIVGPGFGLSALQIKLVFVATYLLKAAAMLVVQKSALIGLTLLTVGFPPRLVFSPSAIPSGYFANARTPQCAW